MGTYSKKRKTTNKNRFDLRGINRREAQLVSNAKKTHNSHHNLGTLYFTNQLLFPNWTALTQDKATTKTYHCNFFHYPCHTIISCKYFHTHGYGTVLDNDRSRNFGCSVVYYFPHHPQQEYDASKQKNPPIRESRSTSAFSYQYNNDPDFLMDKYTFSIEEQEYHFKKQRKKIENTKTVRKKNEVRKQLDNLLNYD